MSAPGIVTILTLLAVISLQELLLFAAPGIENAAYSTQDLLADESAPAMSVLQVEELTPLGRQRRHDEYEWGGRSLFGRLRGLWGHGFGRGRGHDYGHGFGHGFEQEDGHGYGHGFGQETGHGFGHDHGFGHGHGHGHGRGHGHWRGRGRPDSNDPVGPTHHDFFSGPSEDSSSGESSQSSEEEETPNVPKATTTTTTSVPSTTTTTTSRVPTISSTTEDPTLNIDIRIGTD